MTPENEALAFRIWAYCEPLGWDCTPTQVADALGVTHHKIGKVCQSKGWARRMRATRDGRGDGRSGSHAGYIHAFWARGERDEEIVERFSGGAE